MRQASATSECDKLRGVRVVGVGKCRFPEDNALAFEAILKRAPTRTFELVVEDRPKPLTLACRKDYTPPPYQKLLR